MWNSTGVRITEIRVNGSRVDARLESRDGLAWLAVLWTEAEEPTHVSDVVLYERPLRYEPGSGRVVVLNGPSSVGKSSLMAAFADSSPTPWAALDEPFFGRLPSKFLAWPETRGPVVDGVLAALAASAQVGNQLIVSAGGIKQRRFRDALASVDTVYVGLDAPLNILLERQATQADKFGGLAEESVGIHQGWTYDLQIDTSSTSSPDAARLLADFLDRRDE